MLLEGLEVVFIVLTFGSTEHRVGLAAIGAGAAVVLVAGVGVALRAPLARVPENTMKFAVGIMLTSFGTFWAAEGAGAHWPGGDASLAGVLVGHGRRLGGDGGPAAAAAGCRASAGAVAA